VGPEDDVDALAGVSRRPLSLVLPKVEGAADAESLGRRLQGAEAGALEPI
jgi:citrate lyase beta subunit